MTNADLDKRIAECAKVVGSLCEDLQNSVPNLEQAVALGALVSCSAILTMLAGIVSDNAKAQADEGLTAVQICEQLARMGLLEVVVVDEESKE